MRYSYPYLISVELPSMDSFPKYSDSSRHNVQGQRCMFVFLESIKSQATRELYSKALHDFTKFVGIKPEDLLNKSQNDIQIMIENYIVDCKSHRVANTIDTYLFGIKHFLEMNDIILNWRKLKKFLPDRTKPTGSKAYTDEDVRTILSVSANKKFRALIHFLASSGVRVGSLSELKFKDLHDMKHGCKSVLVYAGDIHEYTTFISHEAVKALDEYTDERKQKGDIINSDSFVFVKGSEFNFEKMSDGAVKMFIKHYLNCIQKSSNFRSRDNERRYEKMGNHAFRKRFNTILKSNDNCNISLSERLMGHNQIVRLDNSYLDPTKEKLFDEYLKALPLLLVDEKYKFELDSIKKQQRIDELESSENRIKDLESKLLEMKLHLENIETKVSS